MGLRAIYALALAAITVCAGAAITASALDTEATAPARRSSVRRAEADIELGRARVLQQGKALAGKGPLIDEVSGLRIEIVPEKTADMEAYNAAVKAWAKEVKTPDGLKKWLQGKEVVQVQIAGPFDQLETVRQLVKWKATNDFTWSAGHGGGPHRGFVQVVMKVTEENTNKLLLTQEALEKAGYAVDPGTIHTYSLAGEAEARKKAHELLPGILAAMKKETEAKFAGAQCTVKQGENSAGTLDFKLPEGKQEGSFMIRDVTPTLAVFGPAAIPAVSVDSPRLGLWLRLYFSPQKDSPERQAAQRIFLEAVKPVLELDPDADLKKD